MNSCECPNPPGGFIRCDDNQIAICKVINGLAYTQCIGQDDFNNYLEIEVKEKYGYYNLNMEYGKFYTEKLKQKIYLNWTINVVSDIKRELLPLIPRKAYYILESGKYDSENNFYDLKPNYNIGGIDAHLQLIKMKSQFKLPKFIIKSLSNYYNRER